MEQQGKILVTDDGVMDLSLYSWDDQRFSDILVRQHAINTDQALDISKFLREEIAKMGLFTITLPIIERMIEAKLLEFGLTKPSPVRLDFSIFVNKGMVLSENAKTVLKKRYLKKNGDGKTIEAPAEMFRRVARHIAGAEAKYGTAADVEKAVQSGRKGK